MKACNSRFFSRREFAAFGALGITGIGMAQTTPLTAGQVVDRIKELQPWFRGDYRVVLQDGQTLVLGRNYRERLRKRLFFSA